MAPSSRLIQGLNPDQARAVSSPDNSHAMVVAGAGSGKTRVLTHRIAWLIEQCQLQPHAIMAVTFTNKAAREMEERLSKLLAGGPRGLWVGTFHGLAHRLLRLHWHEAGLNKDFQVMDSDDQKRWVKRVIAEQGWPDTVMPLKEAIAWINRQKDAGRRPSDIRPKDAYEARFRQLYDLYSERVEKAGQVDFGELLLRALEVLRDTPALLAHYQSRFRQILVDEFQDTNVVQYEWLKLLSGGGARVFAVGDVDQCLVAGSLVETPQGPRAIEEIKQGDIVLSRGPKGVVVPSPVTDAYRSKMAGRCVRITLASGKQITSTPEHAHFAGFRPRVSPQCHLTYVMHKAGKGYRVGTTRMYSGKQGGNALGYRHRSRGEHADAVWVVGVHEDEKSARLQEYTISMRYGLPMIPFVKRARKGTGFCADQGMIDVLFDSIDTDTGASSLFTELGMSPDHPHYVAQSNLDIRKNVTVVMCAQMPFAATRTGVRPLHLVSAQSRDPGFEDAIRQACPGVNVRFEGVGGVGRRFTKTSTDLGRIMEIAHAAANRLGARIVISGRMGSRSGDYSLPLMPASNIVKNMAMFASDGALELVVAVEHIEYEGDVFDLDVGGAHNFVANGIVTHNSVYAFRGARVGNMHDFQRDFSPLEVVKLEQNYRSTRPILEAANAVIEHNGNRPAKVLWTDREDERKVDLFAAYSEMDEAAFVVDRVVQRHGAGQAYATNAVLYRTNAQSRAFEEAFMRAGIPYRIYGGLRFFERAEVKDAMAYVRLLLNRNDDEALERALATPSRGIGAKTIEEVRKQARQQSCSFWQVASAAGPDTRPRRALRDFCDWLDGVADGASGHPMEETLRALIDESGLRAHHEKDSKGETNSRTDNLDELVSVASRFRAARASASPQQADGLSTLSDFLAHAVLEAGEAGSGANGDAVQLMTLHSAKGLEFPAVYLVGWEQGLFPSQRALMEQGQLEEERRLAYVGITRAERELAICHAEQRTLYGRTAPALPSAFLDEIPEQWTRKVRPSSGSRTAPRAGNPQSRRPAPCPRAWQADDWRPGQQVRHPRHGLGVVIASSGFGPNARVHAAFKGVGAVWVDVGREHLTRS